MGKYLLTGTSMKNSDQLRYFIYCRKSSEDSHRQIASIDDQINSLARVVEHESLNVVGEPITEERSAKEPGRLGFTDMLSRIQKGEANAILCWDIDRLTRNPIDGGSLCWMLQNGVIRIIKTPSRSYYPEDAGLLLSIEQGRATDFVIRLSKNVKRGLNSKAMRGWRPSGGPIGYINVGIEKGSKTIDIDPERFELVRKMWDLFLTGTYSVSKIRDIATNEWGLRTLQRRKIGGKSLSMSHMYKIFNDPFYYGEFPWKDPETGEERMIKGKHKPMITEQEYWRAQALLGKKGKPQPKTKDFAYTGIIRCGECQGNVTAEEKFQVICSECKHKFSSINRHTCPKCKTDVGKMSNPKHLHYIYYHCIKKSHKTCTQRTIRLEDLEENIVRELKKIEIDEDYLKLALDYLKDKQNDSGREEKAVRLSLQSAYDSCQTRLRNLHREYTSPQNTNHELYTPEEFRKQKAEIVTERNQIQKQMEEAKSGLDASLQATERVFNFCAFALKHFNTDDLRKKRTILSTLGSNVTLKDRKLRIEKLYPFLLIENEMAAQKRLNKKFEPKKVHVKHGLSQGADPQIVSLLRGRDSNPRPMR